jgi:MerR family transcriptional regulator, light-induced transcriptional regulator
MGGCVTARYEINLHNMSRKSETDVEGFSIGEMAARSGVPPGTLRMWESRYGFPAPQRLPAGHRRYSSLELERVRRVVRARQAGLPLAMAIERTRHAGDEPQPSVYGGVRASFPHLHPRLLAKPLLGNLTRALEDECCARAPHPVLFGAFQHERFYRQAEMRWRELARAATSAIVLAEFAASSRGSGRGSDRASGRGSGRPAEVPLAANDPMVREWVVVCDAPELPVCLAAWERPRADGQRLFETVWSIEPAVVREAARMCCELAARTAPELAAPVREQLAGPPPPVDETLLRTAVELATRVAVYAAGTHG